MKNFLQFPLIRIMIAILFVGIAIVVGQTVLNLLRSALSITNKEAVNLLAFVIVTPAVCVAYWMYVRYVERRELTELGHENALWDSRLPGFH